MMSSKMPSRSESLTAQTNPAVPAEEMTMESYPVKRSEIESLLATGGEMELASGCKLVLEEDAPTEAAPPTMGEAPMPEMSA